MARVRRTAASISIQDILNRQSSDEDLRRLSDESARKAEEIRRQRQAEADAKANRPDPYEKYKDVDLSDFSDPLTEEFLRKDDVAAVIQYKNDILDKETHIRVWMLKDMTPQNEEYGECPLNRLIITRVWFTDYVDDKTFRAFWGFVDDDAQFPFRWPQYMDEIASHTFFMLRRWSSMIISAPVPKIGDKAFAKCPGLAKVAMPDTVTELGELCFSDDVRLKAIKLSPNIKEIPKGCFRNTGFDDLSFLGGGIEIIGPSAFSMCSNLTKVTIPDSVKEIQSGAFFACPNLTHVSIPNNKDITIDPTAFNGCDKLVSIMWNGEELMS